MQDRDLADDLTQETVYQVSKTLHHLGRILGFFRYFGDKTLYLI
ncbi:hypothetical protein [Turicibacter sp. TA25]|nr:hypothetical protein [Turicibacter sp. TA25]